MAWPPPAGVTPGQLDLFLGPHVPQVRFEGALDRLDLDGALPCAPEEWREATAAFAAAARIPARRPRMAALGAARVHGWPAALERAWQRLVGRALDRRPTPETWQGEPAGAYLLRGGEEDAATLSLHAYLAAHPSDAVAWATLSALDPFPAAVRAAFHGGPTSPVLEPACDAMEEDGIPPSRGWTLVYALLTRLIGDPVVEAALAAEALDGTRPLPVRGDGLAFAIYLLEAEQVRRTGELGPDEIRVRRALQGIHPGAFQRYRDLVGAR